MSIKVVLDLDKCQGYANCLIEAPELWDFDEDANKAVLLQEEIGEELKGKAESSARGCPAQAITVVVD